MSSKGSLKTWHKTRLGHASNSPKTETCPRHWHVSYALNWDVQNILGYIRDISWYVLLYWHKVPFYAYSRVPYGRSGTFLEVKSIKKWPHLEVLISVKAIKRPVSRIRVILSVTNKRGRSGTLLYAYTPRRSWQFSGRGYLKVYLVAMV